MRLVFNFELVKDRFELYEFPLWVDIDTNGFECINKLVEGESARIEERGEYFVYVLELLRLFMRL